MAFWQKLAKALVSTRRFEAMEAQSRAWVMKCTHCGRETSIWDMGGIRYKASGNPSRAGWCKHCNKKFFGTLHQTTTPADES